MDKVDDIDFGSILSIVFYVLMLIHSNTVNEYIASTIYFLGLFFEFTMSTLYHAFPYGSKVKRIFRRFDYSSIYLLIGASFAPILLCYIGGIYGTIFVIIQWIIIITGVTLVAVFGPTRLKFIHFPLYKNQVDNKGIDLDILIKGLEKIIESL